MIPDPDGRPRFFVDEAALGADGVAITTAFFGNEPDDGRPRFFFAGSSTCSCS